MSRDRLARSAEARNKTCASGSLGCSNTIRPNRRSSGRVTKLWNTRRTDAAGADAKRFSTGSEGPRRNIVGSELSSLEERSVSSRGRCVWLTSRPSWPLEGGRPREVSRSRAWYRLLGHARGPSSHHPRSNLDTTSRVVVHEQRG